jgi:propanol-preferring alcohol dehydrogenase
VTPPHRGTPREAGVDGPAPQVLCGKSVIGSIVGTRNDLADVFALHAAGRTTVVTVDRKLDEVNEAMADVLAGHVPARVVFRF